MDKKDNTKDNFLSVEEQLRRNQNSHSKAVAKYNKENYKTFSINMRREEYERLSLISGSCGIGKSRFLIDIFNKLDENDIAQLISEYNKD